jgi:predicted enzyme related to lactoylglutathione lyase
MPVGAWLFCVRADDLDGALEQVKAGGGEVLNGPMFALHWAEQGS